MLLSLLVVAAGYLALALYSPWIFFRAGDFAIVGAIAVLVYLFPATFLGIAILSLGASPEFLIGEMVAGIETRSLHRLLILLTLAVHIYRYGMAWRINPPIMALLLMFVMTLVAADRLHWLTNFQMLKSLIGLALPFLFLYGNYRSDAFERYLNIIVAVPLLSVVGGLLLHAAGIRPAFNTDFTGGLRLQGMNIAAYLSCFAYLSLFVCVYQALTTGRRGYFLLAGVDLVIIMMTATRMPAIQAFIIGASVMLFAPQRSFTMNWRVGISVTGVVVVGLALILILPQIAPRLTTDSSGRDVLWTIYLEQIAKNPWFGHGIGAGTVLLPAVDDYRTRYTNAAHNEYLRLLMDAGIVGTLIFVGAMIYWVRSELKFMVMREERLLFVAFMVAYAIYCITDNMLSAPPTVIIFFMLALMTQRARQRATEVPGWRPARTAERPRSPPKSPPSPVPGE
jgi:O-antigen ligase